MLKTDYPTIINGVTYEPFKTWDITNNDVVTTHETEGGTQEDVVIRKGRKSIAVSTTCLPAVANSLVQLEALTEFPVKFFDVKTLGYVTLTMRVAPSSMTVSLKEGSSRLNVNGVYTVSFTLEEF